MNHLSMIEAYVLLTRRVTCQSDIKLTSVNMLNCVDAQQDEMNVALKPFVCNDRYTSEKISSNTFETERYFRVFISLESRVREAGLLPDEM